jgi:nucleoside-diphosphate-sugar epimerase
VYLVRAGLKRPYEEDDYAGPLIPAPARAAALDYENWTYGIEKRAAEDVLFGGWLEREFPVTSLRLPMVNSERDHFNRIYGYFVRLRDGGPILLPQEADLPLRHVYGEDVVQAILRLARTGAGKGRAYNISQDETVSLEEFLGTVAELTHARLQIVRIPRGKLNAAGLLPDCSPFSDPWMSALDNARSKAELGMKYTPLDTCLRNIIESFEAKPGMPVKGYSRRALEIELAGIHSPES